MGMEKKNSNSEKYLRLYRQMVRIRVFEDHANQLYLSGKMSGLTHLYSGQEAVAVGICEALRVTDRVTSTHRGHGHCLAMTKVGVGSTECIHIVQDRDGPEAEF
jgi:acetoin:2,6-dichlorophenolindophenol oxidoreductase subunit alpha